MQADTQTYQAGNGLGGAGSLAVVNFNHASFQNTAGTSTPLAFTFEQDATITDTEIPSAAQFSGSTPPTTYSIHSLDGDLTLSTGGKVAGSILTLSAAGALTINDSPLNLVSLMASGASIQLNGKGGSEAITTTATAGQAYNGPVTLGANATLTGSAVTFGGTVNGGYALTDDGNTTFNGAVGNSTALASVTDNGTTALNGGSVNTSGNQTYNGTVTLGNGVDENLSGGTVTFNAPVGEAGSQNNSLTVNAGADLNGGSVSTGTGNQTYNGAVTLRNGVDENLSGGTVTFNAPVGEAGSQNNSLTVNAGADLNGGSVSTGTSGNQTYNGAVTLGNGVDENLSGGTVTFNAPVGEAGSQNNSLTVNAGADLNGGSVSTGTSGNQTYNGTVTLGNGVDENLSGGTVAFNAPVGEAGSQNNSLTVNAGADLNGGSVSTGTSGNQTYNGTVTLGNGVDENLSGGTVAFNAPVGEAGSQNNSLTVNAGADLNGGSVSTGTGNQTYNGAVTLGNGVDENLSGGTVAFNAPVGEAGSQNNSLTVNAGADLNGGSVSTGTGNQTYNGAVTLGNGVDESLSGGTVAFNAPVGEAGSQNNSLTVNAGADLNGGSVSTGTGNQTYNGAVTLGNGVDENLSGGTVTFNAPVGEAGSQNNSLTVNAGADLNGGSVSTGTSGNQTYNGAVTLGNGVDESLSGGTVTFNAPVGEAGSQNNNLTVDAGADLNGGSVSTGTGNQTYNGNVTLGNGVPETLTGGTVAMNENLVGGNNGLTVNGNATLGSTAANTASGLGAVAVTGNAIINDGSVGAGSLTVSGTTALNGNSVTTSGYQQYGGAVTLGATATTLMDNGSGPITFDSTVDNLTKGAESLTVETAGTTTFLAAVGNSGGAGGATALNSLTVDNLPADATGLIDLNGVVVRTTGAQVYGARVMLTSGAINSGSTIDYGSTLSGASLTDNGSTTFGGSVTVASLLDNGSTAINGGGVNTGGGSQTYNGSVSLGNSTVNSGARIDYGGSVSGASLSDNGSTIFGGGVSVASLSDNGATAINGGGVSTAGSQTYSGPVSLGNSTLSGGSSITFGSTVSGGNLTITGTTITFGGDVNLASLTASGTVNFAGAVNVGRLSGNGNNVNFNDQLINIFPGDDERRILGWLAPHEKKWKVSLITPFLGKRVIKEPGYLKGSSKVPDERNASAGSVDSALIN